MKRTNKMTLAALLVAALLIGLCTSACAAIDRLYTVKKENLMLRALPKSRTVVTVLVKNEQVKHTGTRKGWWQVETAEGYVGYVRKRFLRPVKHVPDKGDIYRVAGKSRINVYQGPRTVAKKLGQIRRGQLVQLKIQQNDWFFVELQNGNSGWVLGRNLRYVRG